MKTLSLLIIALMLTFTVVGYTQSPTLDTTNQKYQVVKGAKDHDELSQIIFTALKENDFASLKKYIPGEEEITYLKKTSSERNKPFFHNLDEEQVKGRILSDFESIIQQGISEQTNWSTVELIDYQTRSCSIENIGCTVTLQTEDAKGIQRLYSYDAIRVKDRWFIFQNLKIEESLDKHSSN
ncbi:MAG TPA: hypothetical protein VIK89_02280 [Cytophagaceae bacterium]